MQHGLLLRQMEVLLLLRMMSSARPIPDQRSPLLESPASVCTGSACSTVLTGLAGGTYACTVQAVNSVGPSGYSTASGSFLIYIWRALVASDSDSTDAIKSCLLTNGGKTLSSCQTTGGSAVAKVSSLSIDTATAIAYMMNSVAGTAIACDVTSGLLTGCVSGLSILPATCTSNYGSVIDTAGKYIYFVCYDNKSVVACQYNLKTLSNCTSNTISVLSGVNYAYLNPSTNTMYIALYNTKNVAICNVNGLTVNGCSASTAASATTPDGMGGYTSAGGQTFLFVDNDANPKGCSVSGTTLTCSSTGTGTATFVNEYAITVNSYNTLAYFVNPTGSVIVCDVAGATATNCVLGISGLNRSYDIAITNL